MRHFCRPALGSVTLSVALLGTSAGPALAGGPAVQELRTQRVGNTTYFQVRFQPPDDLRLPRFDERLGWRTGNRPAVNRLPRLVPQDGKACNVYLRLTFADERRPVPRGGVIPAMPAVDGLDFVGKLQGQGNTRFLLIYPTEPARADTTAKDDNASELAKLLRQQGSWREEAVTLDFTKARPVAVPANGFARKPEERPSGDDLEGLWAAAQAGQFAVLDALSPEFGLYGFAREATARKYQVATPALPRRGDPTNRFFDAHRLYETTTGAAAIAESLALHRMRSQNFRDNADRTVDLGRVPGIDIAEHPWLKMMAGQKPAPEPLSRLVPYDNYYLHFKSIVKLLDASDLLDQWGTTLARAYEVNSRDYRLKERLERQLCLKSTKLARTFGPAVVRGLALTGSDPYVREGSDVTVIFHVNNRGLFLAAVDPFLQEARKAHGERLQEGKAQHEQITIQSYVTPLREVSLHRAVFDGYVVYSNSPAGVRRVIDTYRGKHKALADALDFQYMRTVFRPEDKEEDGFLFLSDPFIRHVVGPALRIKERRRLEGLTSLYMTTHGALFTAWETGHLPPDHGALLAASGLKPEEVFSPEGRGVLWDGANKIAVSDVYNTLHFATPLIELPIDRITPNEEREYLEFRSQYLGLWRRYFDPVGVRLALNDNQVRLETYILPLVQTSQYNDLRRLTGGGTISIDRSKFSSQTLAQLMVHISPQAPERETYGRLVRVFARDIPGLNWLGDWFMFRLDDSPVYAKLAELQIRSELDPQAGVNGDDQVGLLFQVPLTVGVEIRNKLVFAGVLAAAKKALTEALPDAIDWEALTPPYKGTTITRIKARPGLLPAQGDVTPALYYALIDHGWYLSLSEAPIKDLIDRAVACTEGKTADAKTDAVQVNSSLYVAPQAAVRAKEFARFYLEWETQRRALANTTLFYPLYHTGLVAPDAAPAEARNAAMHYLGFVPVSADGAPYAYAPKTDEVVNERHGSRRQPRLNAGVEATSPLGRLLEQFLTIRADLRFREDGVNTVVTFDRRTLK
jgi:hypothetical protein